MGVRSSGERKACIMTPLGWFGFEQQRRPFNRQIGRARQACRNRKYQSVGQRYRDICVGEFFMELPFIDAPDHRKVPEVKTIRDHPEPADRMPLQERNQPMRPRRACLGRDDQ